jgi:hypothetical protein
VLRFERVQLLPQRPGLQVEWKLQVAGL